LILIYAHELRYTSSIAYEYVVTHISTCEMEKERIKNEFTNEGAMRRREQGRKKKKEEVG